MASIKANFIWSASYQMLRIIVPLVTMPYLSRVLGADLLGTYSYTYTVAYYFTLFSLMGLNSYGVRQIAKARSSGDESREFCSIFAMQLCSGILVSTVYLIYTFLCEPELRLYSLIWFFWVASESFDIVWLFFGRERFRVISLRNLAIKMAAVIAIFALVHSQDDLWVYCLLQTVGNVVSVLVLWPMLRGTVKLAMPTWPEVRRHLKPNLMLFAPQVAISCYTQLDKVLLGSMSNMAEVGYFDYSEKISTIPLAVIQALGSVMLPHMSKFVAAGDKEAAERSVYNSVWFSTMLSLAFMFGIAGVSHEFVPVFFGIGYDPVVIMMPTLAVIIPIVAWSNVLGIQCLLPYGRDKEYLTSVVVGAVVNIGLNVLLIPIFQGMGAVSATIASELAVTLCQVWFLRGKLPFGGWIVSSLPYAAIGLLMFFAVRAVGTAMGATVLGLVLQVLTGVVVFAGLSLAWMLLRHDERLSMFKTNIKFKAR